SRGRAGAVVGAFWASAFWASAFWASASWASAFWASASWAGGRADARVRRGAAGLGVVGRAGHSGRRWRQRERSRRGERPPGAGLRLVRGVLRWLHLPEPGLRGAVSRA